MDNQHQHQHPRRRMLDLNYIYLPIAGMVFGLVVSLPFIMQFFGGNHFDVRGKTILLTGASEGMGLSVAKQLAAKGANIIIVARNVGRLQEALAQIKPFALKPSQRFQYISADVSEPDGASRVIAEAIAWNNGQTPDTVWCIAGSSVPGLFLDTPKATFRQQMDVNYWSCVDMAHAILSEWLAPGKQNQGPPKHLVFTSSVIAFYTLVGYSSYAPTKSAIRSFSDTLAQELLLYGDSVKVHTIFPATITSPGFDRENLTKPKVTQILEETDPQQSPEEVAANAISGLEKGQYLVTVGWLGYAMKACAWGGSRRNNWFLDTIVSWIIGVAWFFIASDLDGKVRKYGKQNGHPSTYAAKSELK